MSAVYELRGELEKFTRKSFSNLDWKNNLAYKTINLAKVTNQQCNAGT